MENAKDYLKLHFIVLIWGFTAVLGKLITLPSVELVFYRTFLASIGLGVLLLWWKETFKIGWIPVVKIVGTGFVIAAHWILFFASAEVSTISVCLAGVATCSLWTSFLEPLMNGGKVKTFEVILGLFGIAGLYIIFQFEFNHALGLAMGIGAAFLSSLFTVINGKFAKRYNPFTITFYEMAGACIGAAMFFPFYQMWFTNGELNLVPTGMDWLYIGILSLVCTVYACSVSVELQKRISAFIVNLTINLEPVYGIILAFIVFGNAEKMTPGFYAGASLILLSVLAYPVLNRYHKRRALKAATAVEKVPE